MAGPQTIKQIQQQLQPDECFLDFFLYPDGHNNTMAIFPDTVVMHSLPLDIRLQTQDLNESIVNPDFNRYCQAARRLYTDLFGSLDFTDTKKLYICPYGILNNIPFGALLYSDNGIDSKDYRQLDYLISRFDVEYVLSTATFQSKPDTVPYSLAFYAPATPVLSPFSELPFSRQLAEELEQNGYGTSLTDSVIDIAQLFGSPSSINHLSTHGQIEPDHSEYSELVLGKSKLKLNEVYQHKMNAHLVVLNACNSSRGKVYTDDGVNGFSRAFFSAGAKAVMSNLWEVDDKTSNEIMAAFYEKLRNGFSSTAALRESKLQHIGQSKSSDLAAPYYWAGHRLVGRDMVFSNYGTESQLWTSAVSIAGLIIVIAGGVWTFRRLRKAN